MKYTHTHTHIYIYIYIYMFVCVCVCDFVKRKENFAFNCNTIHLIYQLMRWHSIVKRWLAFVSIGVGGSQKIPLSDLVRNLHKGLAREIFHETGRWRRKEGPWNSRQERAIKSRSVKTWEQSREETSQLKSERPLLRPADL